MLYAYLILNWFSIDESWLLGTHNSIARSRVQVSGTARRRIKRKRATTGAATPRPVPAHLERPGQPVPRAGRGVALLHVSRLCPPCQPEAQGRGVTVTLCIVLAAATLAAAGRAERHGQPSNFPTNFERRLTPPPCEQSVDWRYSPTDVTLS